MTKPSINKVFQIGIVVRDADKTAKNFEEIYGIGPWTSYIATKDIMDDLKFYGEQSQELTDQYQLKIASCFVDGLEIELLEPMDDITDHARFLKEKGEGIHHLAINHDIVELNRIIGERDLKEVFSGTAVWPETGQKIHCRYMDMKEDLGGLVLEIIEPVEE